MPDLIKQRRKDDCAICTISMATARPYEEVLETAITADAYRPGIGTHAEYAILEKLGMEQSKDFRCMHRGVLSPEFFRQFTWGRRAILAVPSLNIEDGFHSVYWTGTELLDPCTLKTYSDWKELRPNEIILFSEAR